MEGNEFTCQRYRPDRIARGDVEGCNNGGRQCASNYWGIECQNGEWKNVFPCQKGAYCHLEGNEFSCKRNRQEIARSAAQDSGPMCEFPNIFCALSPDGDVLSFCKSEVFPEIVQRCQYDETCLWNETMGEVSCQLKSTSPPSSTTSAFQKSTPTFLTTTGEQPICDTTKIFCAESEWGDVFANCMQGKPVEVVHTCEKSTHCVVEKDRDMISPGPPSMECKFFDPLVTETPQPKPWPSTISGLPPPSPTVITDTLTISATR
ncbi:hypothetical protein EK21DRAFT_110360 [Setomelanomma holmii]|uniref:Uncharacterized protein n=1 Tax=Setomelanomma holmii TaxID=210430 RepID=A0A9P4HCN2_9PLEO|nr:hypothetical protein EK21DRAFT_110360 [Setomelanomma holmii]